MSVHYQLCEGIARITFDDGKANAISLGALQALNAALDQAERDGAITVLSGRPGIFSAGFHLGELASDPDTALALIRAGADFCLRLLRFPFPTISACTGHAYPMGAFILLSSDYRLGTEGDFRIGLNEVRINMTVPWFALELARGRLHPAFFQRTAVTGELYIPAEATEAGFLDSLHSADSLLDHALEKAESFKSIDLPHHAATKLRARESWLQSIESGIQRELTLEQAKEALAG